MKCSNTRRVRHSVPPLSCERPGGRGSHCAAPGRPPGFPLPACPAVTQELGTCGTGTGLGRREAAPASSRPPRLRWQWTDPLPCARSQDPGAPAQVAAARHVFSFSFRLQSFPASGSFPVSHFFASGGQSIGVSASSSVLPKNVQD